MGAALLGERPDGWCAPRRPIPAGTSAGAPVPQPPPVTGAGPQATTTVSHRGGQDHDRVTSSWFWPRPPPPGRRSHSTRAPHQPHQPHQPHSSPGPPMTRATRARPAPVRARPGQVSAARRSPCRCRPGRGTRTWAARRASAARRPRRRRSPASRRARRRRRWR